MTYVMKVSKAGFNVLTTENANLSFSSELATHAIYNIISANKPSEQVSKTINHNLGYIPKVWIFVEESDGDGDFYRRIPKIITGESIDYYITTNTIVIETESTNEYDFRVIIFTRSPSP